MYSGRIKKWTGYLPFKLWKERYYFIKGAMFCYSKVNDADQKRGSAFLGICEIEKIKDYLKLFTQSQIWYFKGDNEEETNNFYNIVVEGINKGKSILEKSEQDMNFVKVNINEFEREYLLEEAQEELSISSFESFKTENINKDKYKKLLKKIERKLNLNNITFKGYIDDGEYEKNSLKDISDKYEKIKRNLKRINIFLGGEENKNING